MWFRPIVTKETIERRLFIEIFHLPKTIKFSYLNVENNPLNLPTDTYVHHPSLVYTCIYHFYVHSSVMYISLLNNTAIARKCIHVDTDLTNTYAFYYYNWVQDTTSYHTFT